MELHIEGQHIEVSDDLRTMIADRLEKLGHTLTREQLDEVYHRFTELADRKKSIYDQDILGLLKPEKAHSTVQV